MHRRCPGEISCCRYAAASQRIPPRSSSARAHPDTRRYIQTFRTPPKGQDAEDTGPLRKEPHAVAHGNPKFILRVVRTDEVFLRGTRCRLLGGGRGKSKDEKAK